MVFAQPDLPLKGDIRILFNERDHKLVGRSGVVGIVDQLQVRAQVNEALEFRVRNPCAPDGEVDLRGFIGELDLSPGGGEMEDGSLAGPWA